MPPRPTTPFLARKKKILDLVADVVEKQDEYDLDAIDGAFYWGVCRPDVAAAVERLRAVGGRADLEAHKALEDLWYRYHLSGTAVLDHAFRGAPLPLRPPQVRTSWVGATLLGAHPEEVRLMVTVFSGAWRGGDVARYVESAWLADEDRRYWAPVEEWMVPNLWPSVAESASVRIDFGFHPSPPDGEAPPFVEVLIGLPLPPLAVIAAAYDAVVHEQTDWGRRLRGAASAVAKETAIRTWGVGLLVGLGAKFADAMREVCARGRLDEVSAQRFNADRQVLLARVPEARTCVMQRQRDGQPL